MKLSVLHMFPDQLHLLMSFRFSVLDINEFSYMEWNCPTESLSLNNSVIQTKTKLTIPCKIPKQAILILRHNFCLRLKHNVDVIRPLAFSQETIIAHCRASAAGRWVKPSPRSGSKSCLPALRHSDQQGQYLYPLYVPGSGGTGSTAA